jgi:hypothetical protein
MLDKLDFKELQCRRIHSAKLAQRNKSGDRAKSLNVKDVRKSFNFKEQGQSKYFPGFEVTNIFLLKPNIKLKKKHLGNNEDEDYKPVDYSEYLNSNYSKILLESDADKIGLDTKVFKVGKLRTGLTFKKKSNFRYAKVALGVRR